MGTLGHTWKNSKKTCRKRSESLKKFFANNPDKKLSGKDNPFYGKKHTEEANERNRVAHLGKKQSRETIEKRIKTIRERYNGGWPLDGFRHNSNSKKKMSKSMKGRTSWNKGKHWSEEVKIKMRNAKVGKSHSDNHKRRISKGLVKAYQEDRRPLDRRFMTGYFYSKKNRKEIHYRSSYELFAYELLEKMSMVFSYEVEPFSITYRKGFDEIGEYIPDILITYMDGSQELIEVKPERELENDNVVKKIKAAKKYCKKNDMSFSIWTENQVFKNKIREPVRAH
uniref:Nuclease associated modular domain-containing protein n=1 Tax=viral metagenome TaxID=1070528 RepID=A0A6M3KS59_9ZZZZ